MIAALSKRFAGCLHLRRKGACSGKSIPGLLGGSTCIRAMTAADTAAGEAFGGGLGLSSHWQLWWFVDHAMAG